MDDIQIVKLFWERNESAILEARTKYMSYCRSVALTILNSSEDVEEVLNDTFLAAWNSIPPNKPQKISIFLGKITRNLALNKHRAISAEKRGGGEVSASLDELSECIPQSTTVEDEVQLKELANIIDYFLRTISNDERRVFVCRYWYLDSIEMISTQFGYSKSKVKMILFRTREKLKKYLEKEGVFL